MAAPNYVPTQINGGSSEGGSGIHGLGGVLGIPFHFTEHLAEDVGTAALGFIPGTYHLLTDPQDAIPAIAKGIAHDWAPLVTGHPGEFAKNFYEHPLGPLLDVAALFTGGATAVGKGAEVLSKASYGTRAAETVTRTVKGASEASRLDKVAAADQPVTLESVLDATAPIRPKKSTYTRNTVRQGDLAGGERVIVRGKGLKTGQFAPLIEEPSYLDRLAAYSREGRARRTISDAGPGARNANKAIKEKRLDIYKWSSPNILQKARQQQWDSMMENFASRGGTFRQAIAQGGYEWQKLAQSTGSISAMNYMLGSLHRELQGVWDEASGTMKYEGMRKLAYDWRDRLISHAVGQGRLIEEGAKYDKVSYRPVGKKNKVAQGYGVHKVPGTQTKVTNRKFHEGDVDQIVENFSNMGNRLTSRRDPAVFTGKELIEKYGADRALVDPAKRYHVLADRHTTAAMGFDAGAGLSAFMKMFYRGTALWKAVILGFSPRFLTNNFVGNGLMYFFNYAGADAIFGIREAYRALHGEKGVVKLDRDLADVVKGFSSENWLRNWYSNQWGQGLHETALPLSIRNAKGTTWLGKQEKANVRAGIRDPGVQLAQQGTWIERKAQAAAGRTFAAAGRHAELNYRLAAVLAEVKRHPLVEAEYKRLEKAHPEMTKQQLFNKAAEAAHKKNPRIAQEITNRVENVMGNYAALTGPERKLRAVSPFYTWQRHIVRNSFTMAMDKPIRTATAVRVGEEGADWATEKLGGTIPRFAQGLVPFGGQQLSDTWRQPAVSTGSFNPWAQAGELALAGEAVMGALTGNKEAPTMGESVGSLLNPLVVAGVETLTNKNLLSGAPMGSREALFSPVTGLPHFTLAKSQFFPDDYNQPTLYAKTPQEQLMGIFGLTRKDVYLNRLRQLGLEEKGG